MQPVAQQRLDRVIGSGDEILGAFGRGGEIDLAPEVASRQRPRFARDALRELGTRSDVRGVHPATLGPGRPSIVAVSALRLSIVASGNLSSPPWRA